MEKKLIARDRQEYQAADVLKFEAYAETSLQHFVQDAITPERMFVGFLITTPSATELQVAPGHLWDGPSGNVYISESAKTESIVSYLPVVDEKWLTLSVIGQTVEVDIEPRDFLIDLQTMQTEPRQVAMTESKIAELHIVQGLESSDPQKQNPPTGYTLVGFVRLSPSGVEEVQIAENNRLMSLYKTWLATQTNKAWIDATDPQIASIKSDLAALAAKIAALKPNAPLLSEITRDLANLKDLQGLPDTFSTYGSDWLLDNDESDIDDVDYYARAEEGARFPWANMKQAQPGLFNPYADEVKNHNGLLLPAYEDHIRLDLSTGYAGNLAIGSYQYSTHEMIQGTRSAVRLQYGPARIVCSNNKNYAWLKGAVANSIVHWEGKDYYVSGQWFEHGGFYQYRIQEFWRTTVLEKYMYETTNVHTLNGSQVAQTILAHQSGWLTGIDLYFDSVGADGDINLIICETDLGQPDIKRSISITALAPEFLKRRPEASLFELAEPVFLEAGKLYAIVMITQGNHKIALTQGTNYTQGTLFTSTDGVYHQGDFTKDFMMRLHFARFLNPRTTVELASLDLDGGISDLDFKLICLEPANTELIIEYRKEGDSLWYPMVAGTAGQLRGKPPLLHLRAVFQGDEFVMPSLDLPGSVLQAARPTDTMRHISTVRILPTPSEKVEVTLLLEGWDGDKHTCVAHLRDAETAALTEATTVTETVVTGVETPSVQKKFVFELAAPISEYRIQVDGTTTNALDLFHVAYRHDLAI